MHEELTKAFLFILINLNTFFDSPVFLFLSPTFAIFESSCTYASAYLKEIGVKP